MSQVLERLEGCARAARAAGADDIEVSYTGRALGASRFAGSALTQSGVVTERLVRLRVAVGRRMGSATTSDLEGEALAQAAARALAAARATPPHDDFAGFARAEGARPLRPVPAAWSERTAAFTPAQRVEVLASIFATAAAERLSCAGSFTTAAIENAVLTSGGIWHHHRKTEVSLSVIALDGETSGWAAFFAPDVGQLDAGTLAAEAVSTAARARDAEDLPPGRYDVVLSPAAVVEVLEWLAMTSFSGRAVLDGTSLLCGRRGEPLCDPRVTIADDAGYPHPHAAPVPFDVEGIGRARVLTIDAGVAGAPVTDAATAARLGERESTGHAPPLGSELVDGPIPLNLVFLPGADSPEALVGRVERGLYVTRFHYVNGLLDTRRAIMTGMTRDGLFQIRDGRLGRAARNLRFTDSILDALGPARLGGVGDRLGAIAVSWLPAGTYLAPHLLVRDFHFTGKSR